MEQPTVYVLTCAYNAEKTIRRTIESVLNQTWENFVYIIRDNGSTDHTYEICREYAARDSRIQVVHNQKNNIYETEEDWAAVKLDRGIRYGETLGENDFSCLLDADDEYLPDFFQRAVQYAHQTGADIVAGGTQQVREGTGELVGGHVQNSCFLIEGENFSDLFPAYHWNMRQVWGKLYRRRTLLGYLEYYQNLMRDTLGPGAWLAYGGDTIYALYAFQRAERVGILSGCSHRYYIQQKSVTGSFTPNRVASDIILHNATVSFLVKKCGNVSPRNQAHLYGVYCNAVADTAKCIYESTLSPAEKLKECRRIVENPLTREAHRGATAEDVERSKVGLIICALLAGRELKGADDENLRFLTQLLLPRCGQAVTEGNAAMFLEDTRLVQALLRDEPEPILEILLDRLEKNRGVKKYCIPETVQALAVNNPLLCQIHDGAFLRKYGKLYMSIWRGEYLPTLEEMTGLLLDGRIGGVLETFLALYVSLAAVTEQAPAFIFGKLQLAQFYLRQNRLTECRSILSDLEDMGLSDDEEVLNLLHRLKEQKN